MAVRPLSRRQGECLSLVRIGMTTKEISRVLGISPNTVDNHIQCALHKSGSSRRKEAATATSHDYFPPQLMLPVQQGLFIGVGTLYACDALRGGKRLEIYLSGHSHEIEVHAIGLSKENSPAILAWRCGKHKNQYFHQRWAIIELNPQWSYGIRGKASGAPREGFDPNYTGLGRIFWHVGSKKPSAKTYMPLDQPPFLSTIP